MTLDYNTEMVDRLKEYFETVRDGGPLEHREFEVAHGIVVDVDWGMSDGEYVLPVAVLFTREPHHLTRDWPETLYDAGDVGDTLAADLEGWINEHLIHHDERPVWDFHDGNNGTMPVYQAAVENPQLEQQ